MAEADVTYADVKFIRHRAKDDVSLVSEVNSAARRSPTKEPVCTKCAADVEQAGKSTRPKVTRERVVLLVLIAILVATIIALAVKINSRTKTYPASFTPSCPPPPEVKNETCLKCEAGWELHEGTCYNFNSNKSSWNQSRRSCKDLGGDLVKIDSREEQMFLFGRLSNFMEDDLKDKFWIGLTDSEEEGRWLWVDGSPLNSSFWFDSQPDNKSLDGGAAEADCVRMGKIGGADFLKSWFDTSCNYPQKSICEKAAETGQSSCVYG